MVWAANISVFQRALQKSCGQELADVVEECRNDCMLGASYKGQFLDQGFCGESNKGRRAEFVRHKSPLTSFCR
jgi:hypothetical protein